MNDPKIEALTHQIHAKIAGQMLYQGHSRDYCPHLLGITKNGRLVCHAFQFGGSSSNGPVTEENGGWRFFYLDQIESMASFIAPTCWYPDRLEKAEEIEGVEYKPPAFIAQVLAIVS